MEQTYTFVMKKRDVPLARQYGFLSGPALYISGFTVSAEDNRYWRVTLALDTTHTKPEKFL